MRRTKVICGLLMMGLAIAPKLPAQDSVEIAKAQETVKQPEPPTHFYRLDLVLEQVDADSKPTNSRSYTITISTAHGDSNAEIRTDARIPMSTGSFHEGENQQYQLQNVGVNIDAKNPRDVAGKLTLYLAAEVNSLAGGKEVSGVTYGTVVEQNKWQGQVLIPIGKATQVFSSDDMRSKGAMRMLVTATLLQ
jgi:hypothetical protein